MGGLISVDLALAWTKYFRRKGDAPQVPPDILGVVIMDNNAKGPYPPHRVWMMGRTVLSGAAAFGFVGVTNVDGPPGSLQTSGTGKSVVVVDELFFELDVKDDVILGFATTADITFGAPASMDDCAEEKDQQPSLEPKIGNVRMAVLSSVNSMGQSIFPGGPVDTVQRIPGPWTVGPQGIFFIRTATLGAKNLTVWARGRYYPAL